MDLYIRELLYTLEIPLYPREYQRSKSTNAKYYYKDGEDKIPDRITKNKHFYAWCPFEVTRDGKKVQVDHLIEKATGEKVIANPFKVGKENRKGINGQGIYNGTIQSHDRGKMIHFLHDFFTPFVKNIPTIVKYPICIDVELHDEVLDETYCNGQDWDVDNRFYPYGKAFADVLKREKVIIDDNRYYISGPPHALFCPVEETTVRKLVVHIYKDNRDIILNNYIYKKILGDKLK